PYGAVLSTVSGWLLIISSGIVHDVYQRFFRPTATEREIARASYAATTVIGIIVTLVAINRPTYLQLIVVFSSTGMAAAFLMPALLGCFWRRTTAGGAIAAMAVGTVVTVGLYYMGRVGPEGLCLGWLLPKNADIGPKSSLNPYYLLNLDPCVWALS